jgi:hypothetical protein
MAAAAHEHGYSVLTYEGPGQGSVIREKVPGKADGRSSNKSWRPSARPFRESTREIAVDNYV